jgi:hypothetical protein
MMSGSKKIRFLTIAVFLAALATFGGGRLRAQSQVPRSVKPAEDAQKSAVTGILQRDEADNGIYVSQPKVYDDTSLQLLLNSARTQLGSINTFNQAALLSGIGAVSGGSSTQSAFAAQVSGGPSIPQVQSTANGPTSEVQNVTGASPSTTTTTAAPNQTVTTTNTPPTAPTATLPSGGGFSLPSSFSVNSLSLLNEQMQLGSEIANLSLLLEGSLTDHFVDSTGLVKSRSTIGFPITITTPPQYRDAVAVVEAEITRPQVNLASDEAPSVTAVLPKEKTYNVAAITNHLTSIGGGIATQVLGGSFSFLHGRSTYYVVQDQDTIGLLMSPGGNGNDTAAFAWQFRPVLGQRFVQPGMRQTFAQIAMPLDPNAGCFGTLKVTTYWRRFDRRKGVIGDIISESIRQYDPFTVPVYSKLPIIKNLSYADLGNGQLVVHIDGQFLDGTYIRVGSNFYRPGSPGFTFEPKGIRFTASAADLARNQAMIVTREGEEVPLVDTADPYPIPNLNSSCTALPAAPAAAAAVNLPTISGASISTYDESSSILSVTATNFSLPAADDYLLNVSGHIYGLSDSPIVRTTDAAGVTTFQAIVPTALLAGAKTVKLQPLLWKEKYTVSTVVSGLPIDSAGDKIALISKDDKSATFMLQGNRLETAKIIMPPNVTLCCVGSMADGSSLRFFSLNVSDWKAYKSIVLEKSDGERPELITLPSAADEEKKASAPAGPALIAKYRVTVGGDEAAFTGDFVDSVKSASYNSKPLTLKLADKKTLIVTGLKAAGVTSEPITRSLDFTFADGKKASATLDVVNSKVETIGSTPPAAPAK